MKQNSMNACAGIPEQVENFLSVYAKGKIQTDVDSRPLVIHHSPDIRIVVFHLVYMYVIVAVTVSGIPLYVQFHSAYFRRLLIWSRTSLSSGFARSWARTG